MHTKYNLIFTFTRNELVFPFLANAIVLASVASPISPSIIFVVTSKSELLRLDLQSCSASVITRLDTADFPQTAEHYLNINGDAKYLAVTCRQLNAENREAVCRGTVIRLKDGSRVLDLSAGDYHMEQTPFPVCFIHHEKMDLLVHATDWNRLDITDLETGKVLTERNLDECPDLSDEEDFVFKEWVGELKPSPAQTRLATIGWVWHPIGAAYSFHLQKWLEGSTWETDSSVNIRNYAGWDYYWDSSFCWIDDKRLCIWGVGTENSFSNPSNVVSIFDAETEDTLCSFEGPTNDVLFYDEYLFSGMERDGKHIPGITIWDINTGDLLFAKEGITVDLYIPGIKALIAFGTEGRIFLQKWSVAQKENPTRHKL